MDSFDTVWTAIALVLIIEGCMPLVLPAAWRRTMSQAVQLRDGQLRFVGLLLVLTGVAAMLVLG